MTDELEAWIGRRRTQAAVLDPELARRYAGAMGAPLDVEAHFPPLGHWAYFNDVVGPGELGPDGHPRRGIFLPPVALPRRMFASATFRFEGPLALREAAELVSTIADIRRRSGRTGELVLLDVTRDLSQAGALKLSETQTIVYREQARPRRQSRTPARAGTGSCGRRPSSTSSATPPPPSTATASTTIRPTSARKKATRTWWSTGRSPPPGCSTWRAAPPAGR